MMVKSISLSSLLYSLFDFQTVCVDKPLTVWGEQHFLVCVILSYTQYHKIHCAESG